MHYAAENRMASDRAIAVYFRPFVFQTLSPCNLLTKVVAEEILFFGLLENGDEPTEKHLKPAS